MAVLNRPRALEHDFREKLPSHPGHEFECRFHVRRSDLDVNGHVNNVNFIDWAVESFPPPAVGGRRLEDLLIEFHAEALLGDEVLAQSSRLAPVGDTARVLHRLMNARSGRVLAAARTVWCADR